MTESASPQMPTSGQLWQESILKSLTKALETHRLVIVVGAGVTLSATARQDGTILEHLGWKGLIKDGLEYLVREGFTTAENPRIAKAYEFLELDDNESLLDAADKLKRALEQYGQFPTWLISVFGHLKDQIRHPAILYALKALHDRGATLVTTNYDDLLEVTCGLNRIGRSNKESLFMFDSGDLDGVFHIHGSYLDPAEVVLNSIDYYIVQNDDDARETMRSFFKHKTILFVGCGSGLEDPNFEALLSWAQERHQNIANRHVMLLRDQDRPSEKLTFLLRARCGGPTWAGITPYLNELLHSSQEQQSIVQTDERPHTSSATVLELLRTSTIKENVRVWLKAPDTFEAHYDACEKRHKGTGNWFIQGHQFQHWMKNSGLFLWLNGFAGSGKSVLASTAIQEALAHVKASQNMGLAYFYFSYADTSKQSSRGLLSSLILQLSCQSSSEILNEIYAEFFAGGAPQYVLQKAFASLISKFEHTYIIIDALDESPIGQLRDAVCKLVCELRKLKTIHLLVTSRDEPDIRAILQIPQESDVSIQNEKALDDIRTYIREQLQDDSFNKWKQYHHEIEHALSHRAQGMFRWVDCQFLSIRSCLTVTMLHSALDALPQSLDETYDRMLRVIKPEYQDFAKRILKFLCFSARPIQVCELIEALAVQVRDDCCKYNPEDKLSTSHDFLRICPGMLSVKGPEGTYGIPSSERGQGFAREDISRRYVLADRRIIGLAHFSVREYLVSDRVLISFPEYRLYPNISHHWLAQLCLVYLIHLGIESNTLPEAIPAFDEWYYGTFDFCNYALTQWSTHAGKSGNESSLFSLVRKICLSHSAALVLCNVTGDFRAWHKLYSKFPRSSLESQIILVKWLSFHGTAELLNLTLAQQATPQTPDVGLRLIKIKTSRSGLVQRSGSSRIEGKSSTLTLQKLDRSYELCPEASVNIAIRRSHWDAVQGLLSKGFRATKRIKSPLDPGLDPLQIAARDGQHNAVSLMLDHRKDFKFYYGDVASDLKHPMLLAATNGHSQTVAALLQYGIGRYGLKGPHGVTPLLFAARRGHCQIVKMLLDRIPGYDIDAQTDYGMTAMMEAARSGDLETVQILTENGASWLNLTDIDGTSALRHALKNDHQHVAEYLQSLQANSTRSSRKPLSVNPLAIDRAPLKIPWISRVATADNWSAELVGTKDLDYNEGLRSLPRYQHNVQSSSSDDSSSDEQKPSRRSL